MNQEEVRRYFEGGLIPQLLFSGMGARVMAIILERKGAGLASLYETFMREQKIDCPCPYGLADFEVDENPCRTDNLDHSFIRIGMPKPLRPGESRDLYVAFQGNFEHVHYYTVELEDSGAFAIYLRRGKGREKVAVSAGRQEDAQAVGFDYLLKSVE